MESIETLEMLACDVMARLDRLQRGAASGKIKTGPAVDKLIDMVRNLNAQLEASRTRKSRRMRFWTRTSHIGR